MPPAAQASRRTTPSRAAAVLAWVPRCGSLGVVANLATPPDDQVSMKRIALVPLVTLLVLGAAVFGTPRTPGPCQRPA